MRVECVVLAYAPEDGEGMLWRRGNGGGENVPGLVALEGADELADGLRVEHGLVGVLQRTGGIGGRRRAHLMRGLDGRVVGGCSGERGGGNWIAVV